MEEENGKLIDASGAVLAPGNPDKCEGNGRQEGFECCCDECDFFLKCFPEFDRNVEPKNE